MNPAQLLAHFERIAEAPDAVPRLRRFVVDLAVRGRLVPSDNGWKGDSVVGDFVKFQNGYAFESSWFTKVGIRLCRNKNVGHGTLQWTDTARLSEERARGFERFALCRGDLVLSLDRPIISTGLKVARIGEEDLPCLLLQRVARAVPTASRVSLDYLYLWLQSEAFLGGIDPGRSNGVPHISTRQVEALAMVLPPLAEQHRIVAKVDELMALCDELEAAQAKREKRRDRLVAATLHGLNNGDAFEASARFTFHHLPRLTTRPEHIQQVRKTILNLAVRGRLVPQNPNAEPASELLRRIQMEKTRLAKEGDLKKDKTVWDGLPKEPPHELPLNWVWTCLQDVFEISRGGSPRPAGDPRYFGGPIPWITVREITKDGDKYLTNTEGGLTEEGATRSRFINPGDLLLTNSGATLGVPKISLIRACMNDGVAVLRLFHSVPLNDFAYLYLHSQTDAFRKVNQGMGQPNLNTPIIAGWFFPLPPLAEQHRIVAKVDELMALCDALEAQLITTAATSRQLLEAAINEALNTPRGIDYDAHR